MSAAGFVAVVRIFAALVLLVLAAETGSARASPHDGSSDVQLAVGCAGRALSVVFAVSQDDQGALQISPSGNAVLNVTTPGVAVTCQAVLWRTDETADDAFAFAPGQVTFSVTGPAQLVEGSGTSYTVDCQPSADTGDCTGAIAGGPGGASVAVSGSDELTVHLVLAPGAELPALPAPGAVQVEAVYSAASGGAAAGSASVDVGPAQVAVVITADPAIAGSDATDASAITAQLRHAVPSACTPISDGRYLVCTADSFPDSAIGVEAGTLSFQTTLGTFPNGLQGIDGGCGTPQAPPLQVPSTAFTVAFLSDCREVSVKLASGGHSGDAIVSASFQGAETGATATASTRLTFVPGPVTIGLVGGCLSLQVPSGVPANSPASVLVDVVQPPAAVESIWRRESDGSWTAVYLSGAPAATDQPTVDPGEAVTICLNRPARYPST